MQVRRRLEGVLRAGSVPVRPRLPHSRATAHREWHRHSRAGDDWGDRRGGTDGPNIGRNVWIGPDCIVYGNITIGDGATVLPGSVVSANVSAGSVVEGNPATKVRGNFDNIGLRRSLARDIDRAAVLRL